MKKITLGVLIYLFIGVLSIKVLMLHPESFLYGEKNKSEIGAAIVIFPILIVLDGVINIGTYELGLLLINNPQN